MNNFLIPDFKPNPEDHICVLIKVVLPQIVDQVRFLSLQIKFRWTGWNLINYIILITIILIWRWMVFDKNYWCD